MLQCGRGLPPSVLGRALQLFRASFRPPWVCEGIWPVHALSGVTGSLCSSSHQGSDGGGCRGDAGDGPASDPSAGPLPTPVLQRFRRRRRGSLSPLERLSQLIPAELLSEEVTDLRVAAKENVANPSFISQRLPIATEHPLMEEQVDPHSHRTSQHQLQAECQPSMSERYIDPGSIHPPIHATIQSEIEIPNLSPKGLSQPLHTGVQSSVIGHEDNDSILQTLPAGVHLPENDIYRSHTKSQLSPKRAEAYSEPIKDKGHAQDSVSTSQCSVFKIGDLCLAEFRRKYYLEFKKMFTLTEKNKLLSNWGLISHREITRTFPGQMLKTSIGFPLLFRRPSLEEFVLFMKRGPTISYPKDSLTMLAMMDVNPGDTILEAGSGSGGMCLFLSRAVGSEGRILSFEVRNDHHRVAKRNYQRWRDAWKIGHGETWPDNVEFINKNICTANAGIQSVTFDAVALDMVDPQVALPVVFPNLKFGGVCAVYLANITQVIDLLEGIRFCQLSLLCEKITEVIHKDWLVVPSLQKDGSITQRVPPKPHARLQEEMPPDHEDSDTEGIAQSHPVELKSCVGALGQKEEENWPTGSETGMFPERFPLRNQDGLGGRRPRTTTHRTPAEAKLMPEAAEPSSNEVKPFGSVPYIARPFPWQTGHTAFLVKLRKFKPASGHSVLHNDRLPIDRKPKE